jgi:hypothetical protein
LLAQASDYCSIVDELWYKPEGRRFEFLWGHFNFQFTLSFQPHMAPGLIQLLTALGTRNCFWGIERCRRVKVSMACYEERKKSVENQRHFRETCRLLLKGRWIIPTRNRQESNSKRSSTVYLLQAESLLKMEVRYSSETSVNF